MTERFYNLKRNRFFIPLLISILFHILFLLVYFFWMGKYFLPAIEPKSNKEVALEFVKNQNKSREIVESPEQSRVKNPPRDANLASDKNATARDMNRNKSSEGTLPFSEGITDIKDIIKNIGKNSRPEEQGKEKGNKSQVAEQDEYATKIKNVRPASEFNKNMLLGRRAEPLGENEKNAPYKQTEKSTNDVGGISFNTYKWNFAPYLIELKKRIQRNIYPPPAFTRLGFGGENILKFRIYPDGRLEGPLVLRHQGEKALIETSRKAVEMSAPFMPLPDDFPEKFLEVTANFKYYVMNY